MEELSGKVAIVTGGGTGIGRGVAILLAAQGCKVLLCGRRRAPLEETNKVIQEQGGQAAAVSADVSDEENVERVVKKTLNEFGKVDILVNNAGIGGGGRIQSCRPPHGTGTSARRCHHHLLPPLYQGSAGTRRPCGNIDRGRRQARPGTGRVDPTGRNGNRRRYSSRRKGPDR